MSSLALCAGARAAASSPIKPVTESLLECDVDISPPPAFLSNTFYHIIQSPTHTDKTFFEDLVYLLKCVDPVPGVTLSIAVALMETVDKASWKRMSTELIDAEFRFEDVEIDTLILYFPPYNNLIDPTREAFQTLYWIPLRLWVQFTNDHYRKISTYCKLSSMAHQKKIIFCQSSKSSQG